MPRKPHDSHCSLVGFTTESNHGKVLRVKQEEFLYSIFPDIAILDLATLLINEDNVCEILPEYNKGINNKTHLFTYMANPLSKKESRVLVPALDYNVKRRKDLLDRLRYYAEQRSRFYLSGDNYGKLIVTSDLNNLIDALVVDIAKNYKLKFIEQSDTTSHFVGSLGNHKNGGFLNWYDDRSNRTKIRNNFYSYTQLRKLIIEYLFAVNGRQFNSRRFADTKENYIIHYPVVTTPVLYDDFSLSKKEPEDFEQKQLHDFCEEIPHVNPMVLKKKRN